MARTITCDRCGATAEVATPREAADWHGAHACPVPASRTAPVRPLR